VDDLQPHSTGGRRKARLESFLRREIATTVTTELRDPRIGFVTITRCELSPDNSEVTAYYTLLDAGRQELAQQALSRAARFVQRSYAKHIRMRQLPQLRFAYDEQERKRYADVVLRYPPGTPIMGWTDEIVADNLFAGMGHFMSPLIAVFSVRMS